MCARLMTFVRRTRLRGNIARDHGYLLNPASRILSRLSDDLDFSDHLVRLPRTIGSIFISVLSSSPSSLLVTVQASAPYISAQSNL